MKMRRLPYPLLAFTFRVAYRLSDCLVVRRSQIDRLYLSAIWGR